MRDHVAPWRSVYKLHLLSDTEVTFVLTTGGHNAGIVSELGHPGRSFQMLTRGAADRYLAPEEWSVIAPRSEGSWWPAWHAWLAKHSSAERVAPPSLGAQEKGYGLLEDAPGRYVFYR